MEKTFMGYARPDGAVGIRNHVGILAAMDNVNGVVQVISDAVRGVLGIPIWYGRGQFGQDEQLTFKTLVGLGSNPNLHSVLIVSLEPVSANKLANAIRERTGKQVVAISVQECGDSIRTIAEGMRIAAELVGAASEQRSEPFSVGKLIIGVECGGSDTTSGLAANPTLGKVADAVVDAGGAVVLTETSELLGAEHILMKRAVSPQVAEEIKRIVDNVEQEANRRGVSILGANPVPDNIAGGLTTIEEKSLGAIIKGGSRTIQGVLPYAEPVTGQGLFIMDTPAPACESMTGIAAGGAQLILFATGKGNIIGSLLAPTIKVTGNPDTLRQMEVNIDVEVTEVFAGTKTADAAGKELFACMLKVCSGKMTKAEILRQEGIALNRIQPTV